MPEQRKRDDVPSVQYVLKYVMDARWGRNGILHELILGERGANQARLLATIVHASEPMFDAMRRASEPSLNERLRLAGLALDQTQPVLKELGIELPPQRRSALLADYEHFLGYLFRRANNAGGDGDLASFRADPSRDQQYGPWHALNRRRAYIEARLRHGQDFSDECFEEAFARGDGPRRGQRLTDLQIAQLLGLPYEGFESLKSMRPSPTALNELCRVTGYLDLSIFERAEEHADLPALAALGPIQRIPESDLEQVKRDADFAKLERKYERQKSRTE